MNRIIGFVIIVSALLAHGAFAQEKKKVLFSNGRFTFYGDRMESFDIYKEVYRAGQGLTITRDRQPKFKRGDFRLDKLYLQTPYPILDAVFALAIDEAFRVVAPKGTKSAQMGPGKPGSRYYQPYYYHVDGIRFDPCVPRSFGDSFYAVLNNFTYRNSSLRIILRGKGCTLDSVLLDGKLVTVIPTDLKGQHNVEVFMKDYVKTAFPGLINAS